MKNNLKLELTWIGKYDDIEVEPRILLEDKDLSNTTNDFKTENMLIHGDNLLALKSLEQDYAGKIKCIYIDPPYNTGSAFEYYDDNLEHSTWLNLMSKRLKLLRNLLSEDGVIFIQIDENEQAYLKVVCDEVFGRSNFINMICVKAKASSGASGGGEDRKLKKNVEYILAYSKSNNFDMFKSVYKKTPLISYIKEREDNGKNFSYKSVLVNKGVEKYFTTTRAGNGEPIEIYKVEDYEIKSVSQIMKDEGLSKEEVYHKYINQIFTLENAQTSIRGRVAEVTGNNDDYYIAKYVPVSGRNKGEMHSVGFLGRTKRLVSFLSNLVEIEDNKIYKLDKVGTLWDDFSWSAVSLEGGVSFPSGKKPESLIERVIYMTTDEGDYILDSFLGSGTTIATAHKMKRKWIGIEMGNHAYTHVKERMDGIIKGTDSTGISKLYNWKSGGGYRFYELAPTLIKKDRFGCDIINPEYNAEMLANAVCKHENFKYEPDKAIFWKQGKNDNSYIYVTTQHITANILQSIHNEMKEDEYLLVVAKTYDDGLDKLFNNIIIKKIPQSLLGKCEFGKDDYSFNIKAINTKETDDEE